MRATSSALLAVTTWLVLATGASAHVTLAPPFAELGISSTIEFETPNERDGRATIALELTAPPGVTLGAIDAPSGWRLELAGPTARWSGSRIEGEGAVSFPLVVTASGPVGTETFSARQRYDDGRTVRWTADLTVLPASLPDEQVDRLDGRVIAGLIGLAVVAGSILAVLRLRRA